MIQNTTAFETFAPERSAAEAYLARHPEMRRTENTTPVATKQSQAKWLNVDWGKPDMDIAFSENASINTVRRMRKVLRMPPSPKYVPWHEAADWSQSNHDIAAKYHKGFKTVCRMRKWLAAEKKKAGK